MKIRVKLNKQKRRHARMSWNLEALKGKDLQDKFTEEFSKVNGNNNKHDWHKLKVCLPTVAAKTWET